MGTSIRPVQRGFGPKQTLQEEPLSGNAAGRGTELNALPEASETVPPAVTSRACRPDPSPQPLLLIVTPVMIPKENQFKALWTSSSKTARQP